MAQDAELPKRKPILVTEANTAYEQFLDGLAAKARAKGIRQRTIDQVFPRLYANPPAPKPVVVKKHRSQPESVNPFWLYRLFRTTPSRIDAGREALAEHHDQLHALKKKYGVEPKYLLAFWGLESHYGSGKGKHWVPQSLAIHAWKRPRGGFYEKEFFASLSIIEAGHITADKMYGSWAGAGGHFQFMPTTFLAYSVDANGDRKNDVWENFEDASASAANFLNEIRWNSDQRWGRQIVFTRSTNAKHNSKRTLTDWRKIARNVDGTPLPKSSTVAKLILPDKNYDSAFLVYHNYGRFLLWNRSHHFATTIGTLADLIDEPYDPEFHLRRILTPNLVAEMQRLLRAEQLLGASYERGKFDTQTQLAMSIWQKQNTNYDDVFPHPGAIYSLFLKEERRKYQERRNS